MLVRFFGFFLFLFHTEGGAPKSAFQKIKIVKNGGAMGSKNGGVDLDMAMLGVMPRQGCRGSRRRGV